MSWSALQVALSTVLADLEEEQRHPQGRTETPTPSRTETPKKRTEKEQRHPEEKNRDTHAFEGRKNREEEKNRDTHAFIGLE